ncbi:hypothetical protein [Actinomyces radicidentis]|uniref:hypothetical protein n=1 Tax=Actinomyces radicidentis TaxID=111015 RepID=UPI000B33F9C4|nr:hypothetical protein [Actinomyces radicidentis]
MTGGDRRRTARAARAVLRPIAALALALPALLAPTAPALGATASPSSGPSSGVPTTSTAAPSAASTTADDAAADSTADEQRAAVSSWASNGGLALVRQAVGADADVALSEPVAVRAWNEAAAADAADPTARTDDWTVAVTVDDAATAVLLVSAAGSDPTGQLVQDADVAGAVDELVGARGTELVRDSDGAWYLLADSTVTAVGTAARAELAGPVEVGAYLDVLRERRGGDAGATTAAGTSSGSDWSVWATVVGVVLIGIAITVITVRHERRVMAPLREGVTAGAAAQGTTARRAGATALPTVAREAADAPAIGADPGADTGAGTGPVQGQPRHDEPEASSTTAPEDGAGAPRA